ncbi:TPA: heme utilization cystosolic carrier protein HutX [Vibrio parahaemolyticus]|uniref:heme utilization cystosolic carrier protein HutX n=1 Tax=Vibrio parahaemolyticus TaxID=670 RepID=UPI000A7B8032|nr:heme utilization cystosolic carrier protein HutX [Vibrio parahaemolyticus]MBE3992989.1 heme utilization cystosolic carrier protein HutX [Vibrio parahaemolyticus]HCG6385779.1 heme utilization cystosolic carrier protein HutX [Vibrio parahaemolyticus]HCG6389528.1 heme utilization cystosolic carrier protein HutX [Vibrio parahaemolyticus]HCG9608446.1 heme utilization cystosolic carrier protein HutX [Vibrio parahaemolyticus]HCG9610986.1 heme utilization cystosolic carrier protein HutX [Vibrio par
MESIKQQVEVLLEQEPQLLPAAMAERLGVTEFDVVAALPQEMVAIAPGEQVQTILESLVGFGPVTTIVHSFGSIFEVKAPFPKGKVARGYYNLMGREGELHGHLKLDNVKNIALVSKPFMGRESHYFGFFSECGSNIFKVYLGRDEKRKLIAEQVTAFRAMQAELNQ